MFRRLKKTIHSPQALTKAILEDFDSFTEDDIAQAETLVRQADVENEEIELLMALRLSKGVLQMRDIKAIGERWVDVADSLEEVWDSPNRSAVRSFLARIYCDCLDTHLGTVVNEAKAVASAEQEVIARHAVLEQTCDRINDACEDFGDLPGAGGVELRWRKKLTPILQATEEAKRSAEKAAKREAKKTESEKKKGECDACGKNPRVLTRIASGQRICRTCLRELRPSRPKHLATLAQVNRLRERGINVSNDATKEDVKQLNKIVTARELGVTVSDDATEADVKAAMANRPRTFYTKIAGVTHNNPDGSDRQRIIKRCKRGERLRLVREPKNRFDPMAVKVLRLSGEQLGYMSARVAGGLETEGMAEYLDKGGDYKAVISDVTGGGLFSGKDYGVNIHITYYPYRT